jgi:hypothetical protein
MRPHNAIEQAKARKLPVVGRMRGSSLRGLAPQVRAASLVARDLDAAVEPGRLTSTAGGTRDAKAVFGDLYPDDDVALARLRERPLSHLDAVGRLSGLTAFIEALRAASAP